MKITKQIGKYQMNQVEYASTSGLGNDIVCQIKISGVEVCHCTWHPNGVIHCLNRKNSAMKPTDCPCYKCKDCLR